MTKDNWHGAQLQLLYIILSSACTLELCRACNSYSVASSRSPQIHHGPSSFAPRARAPHMAGFVRHRHVRSG